MVTPSHLKSLQALELAVRTGSFTAAADILAITPAAVGQRVKALEDYLGIELLVRGRSGIRASPELASALPHIRNAFAELEAGARELDLQRGHEIHIASVSDFVELWLRPRLDGFRESNPNILFCINGEGDAPMRLGRVDCRIDYGALEGGEGHDLLFHDFVLPVCSPVNHERTAKLPAEIRLEGFPLLQLDFYKDDPAGLSWPDWTAANKATRTAPERGMRFQRITGVLDAVAADAGITLCGIALISEAIDNGQIMLPYPARTGLKTSHAFTARYRTDALARRHVIRFREWLTAEAAKTTDWVANKAV